MAIKNLSIFLSLAIILGSVSAATAQRQTESVNRKTAILNKALAANGFVGAWQLNRNESDDVLKKMREKFVELNDRSSLQTKNENAKQAESPALSISLFAPETLSVATGGAAGAEITINEGFNNVVLTRTVSADGNAQIYELRPGVNFAVSAFRNNDRIVIETVSPRGNRMIETYELVAASAGAKLTITVRIEDASAKEMLTLRRVYDRAATEIFLGDGAEIQ